MSIITREVDPEQEGFKATLMSIIMREVDTEQKGFKATLIEHHCMFYSNVVVVHQMSPCSVESWLFSKYSLLLRFLAHLINFIFTENISMSGEFYIVVN